MPIAPQAYRPETALLDLGPTLWDPVEAADFPQTVLRFRNDAQADTVGALLERMRGHLAQLAEPAGLLTEVHADGLYGALRLPPELRQHLYFIFKEAVANAVRHAVQPTKIVVTLTHYAVANALMLAVEDDGGPGAAPARPGSGLRTMHERALALRGQLEAGAQPNGGFRVWLQVPF